MKLIEIAARKVTAADDEKHANYHRTGKKGKHTSGEDSEEYEEHDAKTAKPTGVRKWKLASGKWVNEGMVG